MNEIIQLQQDGSWAIVIQRSLDYIIFYPELADFYHILGVVMSQLKQFNKGLSSIHKAIRINPYQGLFHSNLANSLEKSGHRSEAILSFKQALSLNPHDDVTYYNYAILVQNSHDAVTATALYQRVTRLNPLYQKAWFNLGNAWHSLKEFQKALETWQKVLEIDWNFPEAFLNCAEVLFTLENYDEASVVTRKAIILSPDRVTGYYNLGNIWHQKLRMDISVCHFIKAIRLNPYLADHYNNFGLDCQNLGWLGQATYAFKTALILDPHHIMARNNLACAFLMEGNYEKGWPLYEDRWENPEVIANKRLFHQPQWQGEEGHNRILLIHWEQGFGDTLQFCRYTRLAAQKGWRVWLDCQPPLKRLLKSLDGVERVVSVGDNVPHFDYHCPMMSLPHAVKTTIDTIPYDEFYLKAEKSGSQKWKDRLDRIIPLHYYRIGLVCRGESRVHREHRLVNERRSIEPNLLSLLMELPRLQFINLQKDNVNYPKDFNILNFMSEMEDFQDTAALISQLDLVISVDSAVAHLAAALGKPVWMMDRYDSCWRWLRDSQKTKWYPSMHIFRQTNPGDWKNVVERMRVSLLERLIGIHQNWSI